MDSTNPTDPDPQPRQDKVQEALLSVGGIHFTVLSVMILIATMTPRGALRLNPQLIGDQLGDDFEEVFPPEQVRLGKHPISEKEIEKDEYSSSIATTEPPTEPDAKHESHYDVTTLDDPVTPVSPSRSNPIHHTRSSSPISGVYNSADDRERERVLRRQRSASRERPRRPSMGSASHERPGRTSMSSAGRERQPPLFETRVHMPTGIRVDLNVSARALPQPPHTPSPHTPHPPHTPHTPVGARTHLPF